jgi:hypothetical protein
MIGYLVFSPYSILNHETANSDSNPTQQNTEIYSFNNENIETPAISQESKLKEEFSETAKNFVKQIKELISNNNLDENSNLRSQIIAMIDNAEKSFINLCLIPDVILEEIESLKVKLFLDEKIVFEKTFLSEDEYTKKDFDEVSKLSYTNSYMSESTMNQSDSDDIFPFIDKSTRNSCFKNNMKIQKQIYNQRCWFVTN